MKTAPRILSLATIVCALTSPSRSQATAGNADARWTRSFDTENCRFATTGENKYFILKPTYQLIFVGIKGQDTTALTVTVTEETKKIGNVETRVVEEKESINTWAGRFTQCMKIEETTPLEPGAKEYKLYAPGIGLVKDGNLGLVKYGLQKKL